MEAIHGVLVLRLNDHCVTEILVVLCLQRCQFYSLFVVLDCHVGLLHKKVCVTEVEMGFGGVFIDFKNFFVPINGVNRIIYASVGVT